MTIRINLKSLVVLAALAAFVAIGLAYALQVQRTITGSAVIGRIISAEDILLWQSASRDNPLTQVSFGTLDLRPSGELVNPVRKPVWVELTAAEPLRVTVEATSVQVTAPGTSARVMPNAVQILFGPAGGVLRPAPEHAVIVTPGTGNMFAGELGLKFLKTPAQLGGPGTQISFDILFKAETPPVTGRIAFTSDRDGNREIYVMNPDGTGQTRLTSNPAEDAFPAWSPDGSKIAFASDRDGNEEVYVMNADGSEPRRLTYNPTFDGWPAWSPDGSKIAFTSYRDSPEIYVMGADGSNQTRLTRNSAWDEYPVWSPRGGTDEGSPLRR